MCIRDSLCLSGRQTPLARPPAPAPVLHLATLRSAGPHPVPSTGPYLRWAFGQSAVIAKRDHHLIAPLAQRLEARMGGNKFKANTVLAIKLARAVYFMLKNKTVFDPERLAAVMMKN